MHTGNVESQPKIQQGLKGFRCVFFESRESKMMADMIRRFGGEPLAAPSLQEIPLEKNPEAFAFAEKLLAGDIDVILFMTGVGTRLLLQCLETRYDRQQIIGKLKQTTNIARGPKPVKVMRENGIPVTLSVPEPNTWRDILELLDESERSVELKNRTLAVQEYGVPNEALLEGLKKRGARILRVPVYRWALPDDTGPLKQAIHEIISGRVQIAFFTTAIQIQHVLRVAQETGAEDPLKQALRKMVVASVGPNCTETIENYGLAVDFEPSHPKMGHLIAETASHASELVDRKKHWKPSFTGSAPAKPDNPDLRKSSPFLQACRLEKTSFTPVWLMRQAGRYLKEYRELRARVTFPELCRNKELAAEAAITAQQKLKADAAILFSDILLLVEPLGFQVEYADGESPQISGRSEDLLRVDLLPEINPAENLAYVFEAVRTTRRFLDSKIPLIGFSGAPFTLAAYLLEGGGSRNFNQTKRFMLSDEGAWHALMEKLCRGILSYLSGQIQAGADALQIFDSWVGCLGPEDYRRFVLPHMKRLFQALPASVPVIHFGTGTSAFLKEMSEAGGQVLGVDFRVRLNEAWETLGFGKAIQGNLDPAVLFADLKTLRGEVQKILTQAGGRPGHIFNLGHGVLPQTPEENVIALIDMVHEMSHR